MEKKLGIDAYYYKLKTAKEPYCVFITRDLDEETKVGKCMRFDSEQAANSVAELCGKLFDYDFDSVEILSSDNESPVIVARIDTAPGGDTITIVTPFESKELAEYITKELPAIIESLLED